MIGVICAYFASYWALSLGLTWLTPYLIKVLGYSQQTAGTLSALPWLAGFVVVITSGWLSQRMLAGGIPSRVARGVFGGGAVLVGGVLLLLMALVDTNAAKIALLTIGASIAAVIYVVSPAIIGQITPYRQRAAMLGITGGLATLAGVAPYVMGSLIESAATPADGYNQGYLLNGAVMVIGGLIGALLIDPDGEVKRLAQASALDGAAVPAE